MKTYKLACIIITALFFAVIYPAAAASKVVTEATADGATPPTTPTLSVETLGAVRSINIGDGEQYGVGLDVGVRLNKWVALHGRAITYETPDDWRGSAIDEASVLVEATILSSDNGIFALSGVGGADYDVTREDFGFSVGPRVSINLTRNVAIVGESRLRAWFNDTNKDIISTAGIKFSF